MMRYLINGKVLTALVLATGAIEIVANVQAPTLAAKLAREVPPSAVLRQVPTYIAQSSTTNSIDAVEKAIYSQVNQYRASRGLPPLTANTRMSEQARIHSQNMASGKVAFGHQGFAGRVTAVAIPYSSAAENVAYNQGYSDPATQAVQGWIKSTGHRQNMEGNFNLTGIGVATNAKGQYYFTQMFIRSR
ncbi:CAP domain-containing protein [Aliterella atlantica]|uniref:SCP domain-containing protein n=1 Tax=Aliterella atlantica CENA595 TaxID=1618023 RepID=A0A0D8ZRE1_9CYAN|nr:CAP domain-containing protein [Aliterella atlantica]KJH69756.1 hypothetical protein UH38_21785 [Aliterella atlantica CENA595]